MLAGVCGTDPFRLMPVFLDELRRIGFSGVQNFPTVGLFDGTIRVGLEETGMGYGLEVDMIRLAHERDFLTAPYVFNDDEATAMAEAGADVLVPHMGLTTGGAIGADTAKTLDESVQLVQGMHDAAKRVNPEILVLCHGGPIAEPEDAAYVLANTEGVVGFFGASSMERLPTEIAMTENMRRFKAIPVEYRGGQTMSSFVKQADVRQEQFDWGVIGWRLVPDRGLEASRDHGRHARARRGPRLPPASRAGGDDHRQAGRDHAVHRAGVERRSASATRCTSTRASSMRRSTTARRPRTCRS